MLTASRALTRASSTGEPLPQIPTLAALYSGGVRFRRGQMVMLAGRPKSAKSNFAMWLTASLGLRTLYVSADMSAFTANTRLAAFSTGYPVETVEEAMLKEGGADWFSAALAGSKIQWCFDSNPTPEDITLELDAYVEAWDAYPEAIVVDNLMNVQASEEFAGQQYILQELHKKARETGAFLLVLHHCSEANVTDTTMPPSSKQIMNKVSQLPEIILTCSLDPSTSAFRLACVGNRSGRGDASGKTFIELHSDLSKAQFEPPRPIVNPYANHTSYSDQD